MLEKCPSLVGFLGALCAYVRSRGSEAKKQRAEDLRWADLDLQGSSLKT